MAVHGFVLAGIAIPVAAQTPEPVASRAIYEVREYRAENGRRIRITSLGNLVALETPYGFDHISTATHAREGYVVSYDDPATGVTRVVYDVHDLYSRTIGGYRDFVPDSFSGPATDTTFAVNTLVTAVVAVHTQDSLIRLTHRFEWLAGTGRVKVTTTVATLLSIPVNLRSFKRHADINVDGGGGYGGGSSITGAAVHLNDWSQYGNGILASERCSGCAPGPPPSPLIPETVSTHVVSMTGSPAPPHAIVKSVTNNSELTSSGPSLGTARTGSRRNEDNQVTLVWTGSTLVPGATQSFTTLYQVE
jgi:hypothetical protein